MSVRNPNMIKNHYWTWPIAIYLFLGGLGGGSLFLMMVFQFALGIPADIMAVGGFIALVCLGIGCFFLVFELGQPTVFLRVFLPPSKKGDVSGKSIIKWGAYLLSVSLIFGFLWFLAPFFAWLHGFTNWAWLLGYAGMTPFKDFCLILSGLTGFGVVVYTGVMLASNKSKVFWSTPLLPVLFTISALSTACALLSWCCGGWTSPTGPLALAYAELAHEILHSIDLVLVIAEIITIFIYVLMLAGAGNVRARQVAHRWLNSKLFWGGMVFGGLVIPFFLYLIPGAPSLYVAPFLILCGGCLLRFLVVLSDERRIIPGEDRFFERLPKGDEKFLNTWEKGENLY